MTNAMPWMTRCSPIASVTVKTCRVNPVGGERLRRCRFRTERVEQADLGEAARLVTFDKKIRPGLMPADQPVVHTLS